MVNSAKIGMELHNMLPEKEAPEYTEGYEGFYHLISFHGDVEQTNMYYIIRDHDKEKFVEKKENIKKIVADLNNKYGEGTVHLELNDQYYNMKEKIEPVFEIVEVAKQAMENLGITPDIKPIRGGTDGSQLSFMGLPTPNLFTGGENFHGKYEYASLDVMMKSVETIVEIVRLFEERA